MLGEGYRDIQTFTAVAPALHPVSSSTARNGAIITNDGMGLTIDIYAADLPADLTGSAYYGFTLKESDASDMTGETDVAVANLIIDGTPGAALPTVTDEAEENALVARIQYRGNKGYLRLATTKTGSPSAAILYAIAIKSGVRNNPPA